MRFRQSGISLPSLSSPSSSYSTVKALKLRRVFGFSFIPWQVIFTYVPSSRAKSALNPADSQTLIFPSSVSIVITVLVSLLTTTSFLSRISPSISFVCSQFTAIGKLPPACFHLLIYLTSLKKGRDICPSLQRKE